MMNEMSNLINNYETQMNDYVEEIDKKQEAIEDLTRSRARLDDIITKMEVDLNRGRASAESENVLATSNYQPSMMLHSPEQQKLVLLDDSTSSEYMNTQKKVENEISKRDLIPRKEITELESHLHLHKSEIMKL